MKKGKSAEKDFTPGSAPFNAPTNPAERVKAELELNYRKNTNAPFRDSLTGLFNHGFFLAYLDQEIRKQERCEGGFTLCLIDIDSFSLFNKKHTPVEGDRILRKIGEIISQSVRQCDLPARYSGDSFAILMANCDSPAALGNLERIRNSVRLATDGQITISAGLAAYPKDSTERDILIHKAHEALIEAKIKGRNKSCSFEKRTENTTDATSMILIVDDDPRNLKLLEATLKPFENYTVVKASSGEEALLITNRDDIDLILLDVMMPDMDGYEVCNRLKSHEATRLIPIVMVTALDDLEAKIKGIEAGADDFIAKPPNKVELLARIRSLVRVKVLNRNLTNIENVLISMANAVEAKDIYTQGHILRVSSMAVNLGKKLNLSTREIESLRLGGILHDIGKIGVPQEILNKPGRLDADELNIIKKHPDIGHKICLPLKKTLGPALEVIRHHHEKVDGSGYPDGIRGEEISILARIMAIVDIYDALVTDRPYRKKIPREKAFKILHEEAAEGKIDREILRHFSVMINGV